MSQVSLTIYGKDVCHTGVKVYNALPYKLKEISDDPKRFKSESKEFLYLHSFYTLDEFFNRLIIVCKCIKIVYMMETLFVDFILSNMTSSISRIMYL
jgi:hypothetical protein